MTSLDRGMLAIIHLIRTEEDGAKSAVLELAIHNIFDGVRELECGILKRHFDNGFTVLDLEKLLNGDTFEEPRTN